MNKRMKKKLMKVLSTLLVIVLFAVTGTLAKAEGKKKITFWHIWPTSEMSAICSDFVSMYQEEHPDVEIEEVATQEVQYQTNKLKVAGSNGSQGDVFFSWGGGYAKPYVDAGHVLPLTNYLTDEIMSEMLPGALTYGTYNDVVYALPLKQWAGVLYCNLELFEEYGLDLPNTWDDLMSCIKVFREAGITPLVLGAKDGWHIGMIQNFLAARLAGADYMNRALAGDAPLNTPEIVRSAELLVELYDNGAFAEGTLGLSSEEAQEEFYMGMVPMYFGGSWVASSVDSDENSIAGKVEVIPFPEIKGEIGDKNTFSGGVIDMMMVNSHTEDPDLAFDFALGITRYMSEQAYKLGDSLPAWDVSNIDISEVSPTLVAVNELIKDADGYVLAWDTFLTGGAIETHYQLLQGLLTKDVTPEDFVKGMQDAVEVEGN